GPVALLVIADDVQQTGPVGRVALPPQPPPATYAHDFAEPPYRPRSRPMFPLDVFPPGEPACCSPASITPAASTCSCRGGGPTDRRCCCTRKPGRQRVAGPGRGNQGVQPRGHRLTPLPTALAFFRFFSAHRGTKGGKSRLPR